MINQTSNVNTRGETAANAGAILSSSTLTGDSVRNAQGEDLGDLKDLMIDTATGKVQYAVLSFGGILGMGDKLFAVPWTALRVDRQNECLVLDVPKERLKDAPGFDQNNWPDFADTNITSQISNYYH